MNYLYFFEMWRQKVKKFNRVNIYTRTFPYEKKKLAIWISRVNIKFANSTNFTNQFNALYDVYLARDSFLKHIYTRRRSTNLRNRRSLPKLPKECVVIPLLTGIVPSTSTCLAIVRRNPRANATYKHISLVATSERLKQNTRRKPIFPRRRSSPSHIILHISQEIRTGILRKAKASAPPPPLFPRPFHRDWIDLPRGERLFRWRRKKDSPPVWRRIASPCEKKRTETNRTQRHATCACTARKTKKKMTKRPPTSAHCPAFRNLRPCSDNRNSIPAARAAFDPSRGNVTSRSLDCAELQVVASSCSSRRSLRQVGFSFILLSVPGVLRMKELFKNYLWFRSIYVISTCHFHVLMRYTT